MKEFETAYKGKNIIVTGNTGFKGSWLSLWLNKLGANVLGISDRLVSNPSNYKTSRLDKKIDTEWIDIADTKSVISVICKFSPDYIFHLAAQPIVYTAYENPVETYKTNSLGTINIMEAIRLLNKRVVGVIITSDKVYENLEWKWGYREYDKIGGKDPYSASKGMAELGIKSYVESFLKENNKIIGVARAGNVIGGGDWAENRIIPDCVKAWSKNKLVKVRNPNSTRPWQHVLEPVSGYLSLGSFLSKQKKQDGSAYNFGPKKSQDRSVYELINEMQIYWQKVNWEIDNSNKKNIYKEANLLKLNCDKSMEVLGWEPVLTFEETIKLTAEWYKNFYENSSGSTFDMSVQQLNYFIDVAKTRGLKWAK